MTKKLMIHRIICVVILFVFLLAGTASAQMKDESGKLVGKAMLEEKCSKCHGIDRPLSKTKSFEEWETTVKMMQSNDTGWISDENVTEIVWFLTAKSLFDTKCSKCHKISRPLSKTKNRSGWEMTVKRMQSKEAGWISDDESNMIIDFIYTERGN